jgi:hypothetical protein
MTLRQKQYAVAVKRARLAGSIGATTMRLLLVLNGHPDNAPRTCWPGETRLLRMVHTSRRMLQYAKREAEQKGWAKIAQPDAKHPTCRYTLLIPATGAMTDAIAPPRTGAMDCTQVKLITTRSTATAALTRNLISTTELQQPKDQGPRGKDQGQAGFALVWEVYPRKVARHAAVRVWNKLAPSDALVDAMLDAIAAQSSSLEWKDPDYIPFLCNWLDGHRWEDAVQAASLLTKEGQETERSLKDWLGRYGTAARHRAAAVTIEEAPDPA